MALLDHRKPSLIHVKGYANRISVYSSILRRDRILCRGDSYGINCGRPHLVRRDWFPCYCISNGVVICSRSRCSFSPLHQPGAYSTLFSSGKLEKTNRYLQVEPRTRIPMVAIGLVTIIPALLALIYIGSSSVFEDVVSLSTSGLYASYFIPCSLLLWRRVTGQIKPYSSRDDEGTSSTPLPNGSSAENSSADEVVQPELSWGPWRVPGILGTINNAYACVYTVFVMFWSFWPPSTPTMPSTMNYAVLMTGATIIFSIVYYYVWGKQQYLGPLIEREVKSFARKIRKDSE